MSYDIDESGNIKDLIDYDFFEPIYIEDVYSSSESSDCSYDSFDSEECEDDELFIGKLLTKNINKKISEDIENPIKNKIKEEYLDIIQNYNTNMITYFQNLNEIQQKEIIEIEKEINTINKNTTPLRFQILKSEINSDIKATAIRKIEALKNLEPNSTE